MNTADKNVIDKKLNTVDKGTSTTDKGLITTEKVPRIPSDSDADPGATQGIDFGTNPGADSKSDESAYPFPHFCIVQFAKSPGSAEVKTRMAPALKPAQRSQLHCAMLRFIASSAAEARLCPVRLWVSGDMQHEVLLNLAGDLNLRCHSQQGRDLGERMFHAAGETLAEFDAVVFIGSDCPFIDAAYLQRALSALAENDAVLGPADDGGYVLLGLRKLSRRLFENMPWGTAQVLSATEARLQQLDWSCALLPTLADIDRPDDLRLLDAPSLPQSLRRFSSADEPE